MLNLDIAGALEAALRRRSISTEASPGSGTDATTLAASILACASRSAEMRPAALQMALDQAARRIDRVSIAVTGLAWLGSGAPSVQQQMVEIVRKARKEVLLCTYS